jgi:CRP-like cAMP-binding protein
VPIEGLQKTLAALPFFRGLAPEHVDLLAGCAKNVVFNAGDYLGHEGTAADHFFVLRQGRVAIEIYPPAGGAITIETVEQDEVLGWSWLIPPYKTHFSERALTLVRALELDGTCLRAKCEADPALGYALLQRFAGIVVQRLEAISLQLMDLYGQPQLR